jgi:ribosomal RNA-processing protein 36
MSAKEAVKKVKKSHAAPQEMSTGKKGGGYSFLARVTGPKSSDPRFKEECGEVDHIGIVKNYAFLQKHREAEIANLNEAIQRAEDGNNSELLRRKQSVLDQHKTFESKMKDVEERVTWHREEKRRIMEGKKPFWLDRRAMKEMESQRKFKELKESGKLERYLNKKGRKMRARDKKRGITAGLM